MNMYLLVQALRNQGKTMQLNIPIRNCCWLATGSPTKPQETLLSRHWQTLRAPLLLLLLLL